MSAEPNPIINEAVKTLVSKIIEKTFDHWKIFFPKKNKLKDEGRDFESYLLSHVNEIYNWSNHIEFVAAGKPIHTFQTINLKYSYSTNEYLRRKGATEILREEEIISSEGHTYLLGDPGSGKTTTLKRLIINNFFSANYDKLPYSFPILVRCRAIQPGQDLYTYIAGKLGITYEQKKEYFNVEINTPEDRSQLKADNGRLGNTGKSNQNEMATVQHERIVYLVGKVKLDRYLIELIENNRILLVIDGFDELKANSAERFFRQIRELSLKLSDAKIILTSRPNYIHQALNGWNVLYVNPLNEIQEKAIAKLWLNDPHDFLLQLKNKSYRELTNRPLFLGYLIVLYKDGYHGTEKQLPLFSSEVYKSLIQLLLINWDNSRDVKRLSVYGLYFDVEKKSRFLSHLAFELTYNLQQKVFSEETLEKAYLRINEFFNLPENEVKIVTKELESHTGIFINTMNNCYEFSHLALQEYLCANYLVKSKLKDKRLFELLMINPMPFALAICLSTEPVNWLVDIVKGISKVYNMEHRTKIMTILLSRLLVEAPNFTTTFKLGMAFLSLSSICYAEDTNFVEVYEEFIKNNPIILNSIKLTLNQYNPVGEVLHGQNKFLYTRKTSYSQDFERTFSIPKSTAELIWN